MHKKMHHGFSASTLPNMRHDHFEGLQPRPKYLHMKIISNICIHDSGKIQSRSHARRMQYCEHIVFGGSIGMSSATQAALLQTVRAGTDVRTNQPHICATSLKIAPKKLQGLEVNIYKCCSGPSQAIQTVSRTSGPSSASASHFLTLNLQLRNHALSRNPEAPSSE